VVDDLSMPHSPRVHDDALWVLDPAAASWSASIPAHRKSRTSPSAPASCMASAFTAACHRCPSSVPLNSPNIASLISIDSEGPRRRRPCPGRSKA